MLLDKRASISTDTSSLFSPFWLFIGLFPFSLSILRPDFPFILDNRRRYFMDFVLILFKKRTISSYDLIWYLCKAGRNLQETFKWTTFLCEKCVQILLSQFSTGVTTCVFFPILVWKPEWTKKYTLWDNKTDFQNNRFEKCCSAPIINKINIQEIINL